MAASSSSSEGNRILKHESSSEEEDEGKILKLESLMLESSKVEETLNDDRQPKILMFESEEDREILMKVKSEEGKILKLKEYMEASEKALAEVSCYVDDLKPLVKPPAAKEEKKKMVVVKTLVPLSHIAFIKAMPCPVTTPVLNSYSEEELAYEPQRFQDYYRVMMGINMKMCDYLQALVDQYEKFGYAVDETELTDDDDDEGDEDEDNAVEELATGSNERPVSITYKEL